MRFDFAHSGNKRRGQPVGQGSLAELARFLEDVVCLLLDDLSDEHRGDAVLGKVVKI